MRLKEARTKSGSTQQDVADYLKISRAAYTNIENEKRDPDTQTLQKLADYFGVTTDYLLGRTDEPAPVTSAACFVDGKGYEDMPEEALQQLRDYEAFLREKYKKR